MGKVSNSAEYLLNQLGELSNHLANSPTQEKSYFEHPLQIINTAMGFHIGVLYKISNIIENDLILEVVAVCNPQHIRPDLKLGTKLCLDINNPSVEFTNEVSAFKHQNVSAINIPGWGCDIVGSIFMPENLGYGYLLAGDFFGDESDVLKYEIHACEIMCNLLSSVLMKTQFEQLANYDGLTGLLNSRAIRDELEKIIQRQKRKKAGTSAIILTDIDFFKKVNDQYGHIQGDCVLQEIGELLEAMTRKHIDLAGRYGGEEFLLIYEDTEKEQILIIIERLRQSIATHQFKKIGPDGAPIKGEFLQVTMSFGMTFLNEQCLSTSAEILSRADAALYQSKENGRNCISVNDT